MALLDEISIGSITGAISNNPFTSVGVATAGGAVLGATATGLIVSAKAKKKTRRKKKSTKRKTTSKKRKTKKARKSFRKTRKRKATSSKRIRMTKTGQPYIILANGRARFIKKSSARRSRKLKGGRY